MLLLLGRALKLPPEFKQQLVAAACKYGGDMKTGV